MVDKVRTKLSLADLLASTAKHLAVDLKNQHNPIKLEKAMYVVRTKQLLVKASTSPLTDKKHNGRYIMFMQFDRVAHNKTRTRKFTHKVKTKAGDIVYVAKLSQLDTLVRVSCSCKRFYFAWQYWDRINKSLYGKRPPPYFRKTANRPEVNPFQDVGICKHLVGLTKVLRRRRILR